MSYTALRGVRYVPQGPDDYIWRATGTTTSGMPACVGKTGTEQVDLYKALRGVRYIPQGPDVYVWRVTGTTTSGMPANVGKRRGTELVDLARYVPLGPNV